MSRGVSVSVDPTLTKPQYLRRKHHSLQRFRGQLCSYELRLLSGRHPPPPPDRTEEYCLWPVQAERLAGLRHELCWLWIYAGLVCHLLVPVRLARGCAKYELRLSDLGRLDHLRRGMVVYRSAQQL